MTNSKISVLRPKYIKLVVRPSTFKMQLLDDSYCFTDSFFNIEFLFLDCSATCEGGSIGTCDGLNLLRFMFGKVRHAPFEQNSTEIRQTSAHTHPREPIAPLLQAAHRADRMNNAHLYYSHSDLEGTETFYYGG